MILKNLLFEGKLTDLTIQNGTITAIEPAGSAGEGTDCSGLTVVPSSRRTAQPHGFRPR